MDIWWRPRPKLFASSFVRSTFYISEAQSHINYGQQIYHMNVPLKSLIKYTYELDFGVQQF